MVLAVLVLRFGAGPVIDGLRSTSAWSVLVAVAVTAVTTLCCAWRWRLVAVRLGAPLAASAAFAAVYRAQFLNVMLPGGVLGDVDRALGHGRDLGRLGPAVRAVFWERTLGQAVQVLLAVLVVVVLPSPLRPPASVAAGVVVAGVVLLLLVRRFAPMVADLRAVLRPAPARRAIGVASAAASTGHLVVFLVAARAAGVDAPIPVLLPLAAAVLVAAALPLNVAGWGPREGVAAWLFGMAGLGATTGLAVSVAYGVLATVATAPGALVLLAGRGTRTLDTPVPARQEAVHG